jgi:peptide/nickel transport system permease protein
MGSAILQVSGLGFLGLGLPPPTPEWGLDLGRGRDFITMGVWWASTFPGLMILVSVIGFTLIGEALSEILGTKKSVKMA